MTGPDAHELLELVGAARRATADDARPGAVARSHGRDKLTARERVAGLVDAGTFRELGPLARLKDGEYAGLPGIDADAATAYGDGVIAGTARIDGRPVVLSVQDYGTFGCSSGEVGGKISQRAAVGLGRAVDRHRGQVGRRRRARRRGQGGVRAAHRACCHC